MLKRVLTWLLLLICPGLAAAEEKRTALAPALLQAGADVRDTDTRTPLTEIIDRGDRTLIPLALAAEKDAAAAPASGREGGLLAAIRADRKNHVRALIQWGRPLNEATPQGWTPLMTAAIYGRTAMAQTLVRAGADLDIQDQKGRTALTWAAHLGRGGICTALLDAGAKADLVSEAGDTPLGLAVERGESDLVKRFLDAGIDPDTVVKDGRTALLHAVQSGHLAVVQTLIAAGARVDGCPAVAEATREGSLEMVAALREGGVVMPPTRDKGRTAADMAKERGHATSTATQEKMQAEVEALHAAVAANDLAAVEAAIAQGECINLRGEKGETALMRAVALGQTDIIERLVHPSAGVDLDARNLAGETALIYALRHDIPDRLPELAARGVIFNGDLTVNGALVRKKGGPVSFSNIDIAKTLIAAGADIHRPDNLGNTPLIHAAAHDHAELVGVLLAKGADPVVRNHKGATALHKAVMARDTAAVAALLEAGADPSMTDAAGASALSLAAEVDKPSLQALLTRSTGPSVAGAAE